jgi:hypothetical protein
MGEKKHAKNPILYSPKKYIIPLLLLALLLDHFFKVEKAICILKCTTRI